MKKDTKFRGWVRNIWIDNAEERLMHRELPYSIKEYWDRYKYWLKREFKHQQRTK